jgi:hypothetical protein
MVVQFPARKRSLNLRTWKANGVADLFVNALINLTAKFLTNRNLSWWNEVSAPQIYSFSCIVCICIVAYYAARLSNLQMLSMGVRAKKHRLQAKFIATDVQN